MLVGLVTKNGILIVEFANQLREQGMDKFEAAINAAKLRMRPILMTTLATVLGQHRSPLHWEQRVPAENQWAL